MSVATNCDLMPSATPGACQICGNDKTNSRHNVREMMIGLNKTFEYLECAACGSLQLADPRMDFAPYYASGYYSFRRTQSSSRTLQKVRHFARGLRNRALLRGGSVLSKIVGAFLPDPPLAAVGFAQPDRDMRVLDVGCGSGPLPVDLCDAGFDNLLGIDPFIEEDIQYSNGAKVKKGRLKDLIGSSWDLIVFHHSFEHIWEQHETLVLAWELLSDGGKCIISIPVVALPWKKYGVNWVELDAPRHLCLHTERSMRILASQASFHVAGVKYDSSEFQFWGSELYLRDIPLSTIDREGLGRYFTKEQLRRFRKESERLNREGQGGRASFCLVKNGFPEPIRLASPSQYRK